MVKPRSILHVKRKSTFAGLFLCGLPAAVTQTRHWLDVTLADRWRVKHQLGRSGEAHGKSSCTHQNPCDAWKQQNGAPIIIVISCLLNMFKHWMLLMSSVGGHLPASAGCTGLDPFRFFTGTVGTLKDTMAVSKLTLWTKFTVSRLVESPARQVALSVLTG